MSTTPRTSAADTGSGEKFDRQLYQLALVVVIGVLMPALDATVVNVALNTLSTELGASLPAIQWVVTAYLLSLGVVIPLSGWATDRFGAKPVWLVALGGFTIGSVLCGCAWNVGSLIAFRVVQGLGGGMIMPVGQAALATTAGPKRMGRAMAFMGIAILLGPALGPIVGGLIVEHVSWRWIFFINPPIGLLAFYLAVRLMPGTPPIRRAGRLDLPGLVLLSGGLVMLLYGLSKAGSSGGFSGTTVLGCLVGGAVLLTAFVLYSARRGEASVIDVRLYRNRVFANASVITLLLGMGMYGAMLLVPLYYQVVRGESPLTTGLLVVPMGFGAAVSIPIMGRLIDKVGSRLPMLIGLACFLLGTAAFTQVAPDTSYVWLCVVLFVMGIGLGSSNTPTMVATYSALPAETVPRASGVYNVTRQVGGSFGSALFAILLTRYIDDSFPGTSGEGLHGLSSIKADRAHVVSVVCDAFQHTFWVAFAFSAVMIIPALLLPNARRPARRGH
ncbi:MDR family MFS transporter [Actinomadura fibrosa]|uniref:MDR family MFS transporter n=1 Tax=Actinomadura fibrosa TaxID=111802 RepID=A0ABW2XPL1_9ACTN|nr:MDR family MFS transporter [Actinomadura fibrosa]